MIRRARFVLSILGLGLPLWALAEDHQSELKNISFKPDAYYLEQDRIWSEGCVLSPQPGKNVINPGDSITLKIKGDCTWGGVGYNVFKAATKEKIGTLSYTYRDGAFSIEMSVPCEKNSTLCIFHGLNLQQNVIKSTESASNCTPDVNAFLDIAHTSGLALKYTLNSGLEVQAKLAEVKRNAKGNPIYLRWMGPAALRDNGASLPGHSPDHQIRAIAVPLGLLVKTTGMAVRSLSEVKSLGELKTLGLEIGKPAQLTYQSGITVIGVLQNVVFSKSGKLQILSFKDARVMKDNKVLFAPTMGIYDMAVGEKLISISQ